MGNVVPATARRVAATVVNDREGERSIAVWGSESGRGVGWEVIEEGGDVTRESAPQVAAIEGGDGGTCKRVRQTTVAKGPPT